MNHSMLFLVCAGLAALLLFARKLRTLLVIVGVIVAVALFTWPIVAHHLAGVR